MIRGSRPENPTRSAIMRHEIPDDGRAAAPDVVDPVGEARLGRQELHGGRDVTEVDVVPDGIPAGRARSSGLALDHRVPNEPRGASGQGRRRHPGTDRIEDAGNDRVEARLGRLAHQLDGRELCERRMAWTRRAEPPRRSPRPASRRTPRPTRDGRDELAARRCAWPRGSWRRTPRSPATARPTSPDVRPEQFTIAVGSRRSSSRASGSTAAADSRRTCASGTAAEAPAQRPRLAVPVRPASREHRAADEPGGADDEDAAHLTARAGPAAAAGSPRSPGRSPRAVRYRASNRRRGTRRSARRSPADAGRGRRTRAARPGAKASRVDREIPLTPMLTV